MGSIRSQKYYIYTANHNYIYIVHIHQRFELEIDIFQRMTQVWINWRLELLTKTVRKLHLSAKQINVSKERVRRERSGQCLPLSQLFLTIVKHLKKLCTNVAMW